MGVGGAAAGGNPQTVQLVSSLISLPISFLVLSGIVAGMLPTSFVKGMCVAALYWLIGIILVVVFMVLAGVLMGADSLGRLADAPDAWSFGTRRAQLWGLVWLLWRPPTNLSRI